MKRLTTRLAGLAGLTLLGLAASACNLQWSPYAARVSGHVVSTGELDSALHHASRDTAFRCLLEGASSSGYRLEGSGSDTYDSAFAAFILTDLVDSQIAYSAVRAEHIRLPADGMSLARSQVESALTSQATQSGCAAGAKDVLAGLGPSLSASFIRLQLYEDALAAKAAHVALSPAGILSFEHSHAIATRASCLTGVFVASKATADKIVSEVAAGKSFSSIVAHYAKSPGSSGGQLGCYTGNQLRSISPAIAAAVAAGRTGQVLKPVYYRGSSGAAYLVAMVTSRRFEPFTAALDQLFATESGAFAKAITSEASHLQISVDARYGSWSAMRGAKSSAGLAGRVVPPSGPKLSLVLNPSAVQGKAHVRINPSALAGSGG